MTPEVDSLVQGENSDNVKNISPSYNGSEPDLRRRASRTSSWAAPNPERPTVQHEMIVAYLYQQQRSRLWISDVDSKEEGAFMRESWSHYITAPVLLSESSLAEALIDLNAEVCA